MIDQKTLSLETALLKSLSNKKNFDDFFRAVDMKRVMTNTRVMLNSYKKYFELYDHDVIDWDLFYTGFSQAWNPELEQIDIEYYRDSAIPAIKDYDDTDINKTISGLIWKNFAEDMSTLCTQTKDVSKIRQLIDTYERKLTNSTSLDDKHVHTVESADFGVLDKALGLIWFLPLLQQSLMSITAGQFIIVSADYGTGKTAFVIAQAVCVFKQLCSENSENPILYFNSEGTAADVLCRFLSNLYSIDFEEIVTNREDFRDKFVKQYNSDLFKVIQISDCPTFYQLSQKVKKHKPSLIIIDICDKLAPEEDVQNLKKLYDDLRVLAGAECPIIGTSQSGDTSYFDAENKQVKHKKWLGDHSLYGSKTGKGGAADTIITIGKDEGSLRYVNVVKKKRGEPTKITCMLEEKTSNYKQLDY